MPPHRLLLVVLTAAAIPLYGGITVETSLPANTLISNPDVLDGAGNDDGSSRFAFTSTTSNYFTKGESFTLAESADLSAITIRVDENANINDGVGDITLRVYNLSGVPDDTQGTGQVAIGAALVSQTETLPVIAAGDYLTVTLDTPLNLTAGSYAFAFSTTNVDFLIDINRPGATNATRNGSYPGGELVRANGAGTWQDRNFDLVFAISGTGASFTLGNPPSWPTAFLENSPQATVDSAAQSSSVQAGQSFTIVGEAAVDSVVIQLDDAAASADLDGSLTLEIFEADGDGLPTGSALASLTGELPGGLTTGSLVEFDFPGLVTLPLNDYVLTLKTGDADLLLNSTSGNLLAGGTLLENSAGGWTAPAPAGRDLVFGLTGKLTPPVTRPPAGSGPNILIILADDLGWTDLSTDKTSLDNGSDFHQTPHIDRLANEGLSFTYAFVQQNCAPTRAALLSGQYAARSGNGVYNVTSLNRGTNSANPALTPPAQREDVPSAHYNMAEMLWDAGYVTCHVGKYHVGGKDEGAATLPQNQGFDHNFGGDESGAPGSFFANSSGIFQSPSDTIDAFGAPYDSAYTTNILAPVANNNTPSTLDATNKHLTDAEADAVLSFLNDHQDGPLSDYPFYIQYHAYAVHTPIQPRPDLQAKYNGLAPGTRHNNDNYAALLEGLDQSVGRILNYLDTNNLTNDTLILFLSDNGGHEGPTDNIPLRSRKGSLYNGGLRVPMIVRQPGTVPSDQVTDSLVHAVDLFPTLMQIADGSTSEILDGTSWYDHALDPAGSPRDREPIFYHFPGYLDNRARPCSVVIKDIDGTRFKLIYNYDYTYDPNTNDDAIRVLSQPWELYNITDDISESQNLITGNYWDWLLYGTIADNLASDLAAWLNQSDPTWNPVQALDNGSPVPFPPAEAPDVTVPPDQTFRITDHTANRDTLQTTLQFTSAAGYLYDIEASENLVNWTPLATGIVGQAGSTSEVVNDPNLATSTERFYRAVLTTSPLSTQ